MSGVGDRKIEQRLSRGRFLPTAWFKGDVKIAGGQPVQAMDLGTEALSDSTGRQSQKFTDGGHAQPSEGIPRLGILTGDYFVSVYCIDSHQQHVYDEIDRAFPFHVRAEGRVGKDGLIDLLPSWSFSNIEPIEVR